MIRHSSLTVAIVVAILVAALPLTATAQVIAIRSGTLALDRDGFGELNISGSSRFSFRSFVNTTFDACNFSTACVPGAVVDVQFSWAGNDLTGTATLRGRTFDDVGGLDASSGAVVGFSAAVTFPAMSTEPVSLVVPFDFAGFFDYDIFEPKPRRVLLTGGGEVTFVLEWSAADQSWTIRGVEFHFARVGNR